MNIIPTPIPGVFEATTEARCDARGQFARLFCINELAAGHARRPIVQINQSVTREKGTIRGLHFQMAPHAEAKWVRCMRGKVFDVAVDLRRDSPTFLSWHSVELDAERMNAILIPEGCAHGYQVLAPDSELLYLHTAPHVPIAEGGVRFDDPHVGVVWPLPPSNLSVRDREHPLLTDDYKGLVV